MYIRKTGYVTRSTNGGTTSDESYSSCDYDVSDDNYTDKRHSGRVEKMGRVLTLREERVQEIRKNTELNDMVRQGVPYYSVSSNENACEKCQKHNGAIYPVSQAKIEENYPPFHPNCKCRVTPFSTSNIHDDPGLAEILFWLEIMYGGLSIEEQVREYLDFYGESEFSEEFIARVLSSTANITNISEKIEVFFERLTGTYFDDLPTGMSNPGVELLKQMEGFRGEAYRGIDVENVTIGYGHVIQPGDNIGNTITEAEATELLKQDLQRFVKTLDIFVEENNLSLNQAEYDALLLFSYQQGQNIWDKGVEFDYDFIFLLKSGEWTDEQIIYEMPRFDVKHKGLWRRHMNEALLFTTGKYENYSIEELNEMGYYWQNKGD